MIGVVTSQLFSLQRAVVTLPAFGYFALGKPLGALFQIAAMLVTAIGAHRFWRQQMNMARGRVWAGGWEVYAIMITMFLVCSTIEVIEERILTGSLSLFLSSSPCS